MYRLLEQINDPADLRRLDADELPQLARELREFIISSVSRTGGHLSSNLGTVELAIALHRLPRASARCTATPQCRDFYRYATALRNL
jgi:deoxyxylulose-5-phosphate synthase